MAQQPPVSWEAPEDVRGPAPGLEYGGFGARFVAYLVDAFVVTIAIIVLSIVLGTVIAVGAANNSGGVAAVGGILWLVLLLIVTIGYFPWFWSRDGATPGMKMFGLRVVRDRDGGPITGGQAFLRLIGYWVSGFVFYLGYIWVFIDKRRRGWHDLIAGTVVVKRS